MSYTTYLAHHGIKGQKWGVRRFQNYDGTRIKSSTTKIKAPKGLYYKWKTMKDGRKVYDRTESGQKFHDLAEPIALNAAKKLDISGKASKRYKESSIAEWAASGGVKFNDIRDDYLRIYADKLERDTSHDYLRVYNQTHDAFLNIKPSHGRDGAYTILHEVVGNAMTKTVWKPASAELPTWRESPFYKLQNENPNSPEVKALYADFLKHGKALYKKESRLIELMKEPRGSSTGEYKQLMKDLGYRYDDTSIRADWGPHAEEPYSEKWRKRMLNPDKGPPDLFDERLYNRIHNLDTEEVSHSVIVNDDIYSYRSYLAHHGIKGQKWGVRRFQNYDGTRIKSGSQLVRDISRKHNPLYKQTFIEKLKKDGHWDKKARARRDAAINEVAERIGNKHKEIVSDLEKKYEKDLDDYGKNHYKFEALAGLSVAYHNDHAEKETEDEARKTKENRMLWYMFDDGDQGSFNSVDYFLVSKGKNPTEYAAKMENDKAKALDDIKKLVKPVLGEPDDPEVYKEVLDSVADELFWRAEDPRWSAVYHNASGEHSRYDDDEIKFMQDDIKNYSKEAEDFVRKQIPNLGHSAMSFSEQLSVVPSYGTYLAHHGIKGQKWGVRRFQKADGSLTAAGAKRYGIKSAMSAGRKVGSGLVKAARGGIQKVKEVKARKAAEKLERQKKVWAKTRFGLTMNADKFSIEELREANDRLDQRDRAAKGFADQVQRGVGYFKAIRDVTGAIKDTKDYIEDISGEKERKQKAADDLKYQRQLEKEERDHQRALEKDKLSAERDIDYKREKDALDRESRERISKYTVDAKNQKGDPDKPSASTKPNDPDGPNNGGGNTVKLNGHTYDADFLKTVQPELYEYAMKKQKDDARKARLDYLEEKTKAYKEKKDAGSGQSDAKGVKGESWNKKESNNDEAPKSDKKRAELEAHMEKRYEEMKKDLGKAARTDADVDSMIKSLRSMRQFMKDYKGTPQDFDLDTLKQARAAKKAAKTTKRKARLDAEEIGRNVRKAQKNVAEADEILSRVSPLRIKIAKALRKLPPNSDKAKQLKALDERYYQEEYKALLQKRQAEDQFRRAEEYYINHSDISAYGAYLAHHGIKGQKWGVRRFQNEDGSLTAKGLKRQARKFSRELNRNDKKLTKARWGTLRLEDKISKKAQKLHRAEYLGKTKRAKKITEAITRLRTKQQPFEVQKKDLTERQAKIAKEVKSLNLDIYARRKDRNVTRWFDDATVYLNGTKYTVKSNPKHRAGDSVTDYGKTGNYVRKIRYR